MQMNLKKVFIIFFTLLFSTGAISEEIFLFFRISKVNVRYVSVFDLFFIFVYKKINLPIKQIDKKENWRRIIDLKNNSGWIHWSQLKLINSIIPLENKILFKKASIFSQPLAKIKKGRVLIIQKCDIDWCKIKTGKFKGWIKNDNIWGSIN